MTGRVRDQLAQAGYETRVPAGSSPPAWWRSAWSASSCMPRPGCAGRLCFAAMAGYAPVALVRMRARRRRASLRELWPDAVDNITSGVRAGLALPEALSQLAIRGPEELRPAFRAFAEDYRTSGRFQDCLDRLKARLSDPVGDRLIESLRIAREVGGSDLGRLLRTLSTFLREDSRTRSELEARQGWTVNAARLAVAAPWIVLGMLCTRPESIRAYASATGTLVLVAARSSPSRHTGSCSSSGGCPRTNGCCDEPGHDRCGARAGPRARTGPRVGGPAATSAGDARRPSTALPPGCSTGRPDCWPRGRGRGPGVLQVLARTDGDRAGSTHRVGARRIVLGGAAAAACRKGAGRGPVPSRAGHVGRGGHAMPAWHSGAWCGSVRAARWCARSSSSSVVRCGRRGSRPVAQPRGEAREQRMLSEFPTIAELLALAVGAGEGAVGALERVCRLSHGELSAELGQCLADARAGAALPLPCRASVTGPGW